MILFCEIYRSTKEVQEKFSISAIQAWHAMKWFAKFDDDFLIEKEAGTTSRAWWLKTHPHVLEEYKQRL